MSRRSNLNTVRKSFSGDSMGTTSSVCSTQVVWFDIKINEFLNGLFYFLRMPTSNYLIRRFLNSFVIIETDIGICSNNSIQKLRHCVPNKMHFLYAVLKVYNLFMSAHDDSMDPLGKYQRSMDQVVSYLFRPRQDVRVIGIEKTEKETESEIISDVKTGRSFDVQDFEGLRQSAFGAAAKYAGKYAHVQPSTKSPRTQVNKKNIPKKEVNVDVDVDVNVSRRYSSPVIRYRYVVASFLFSIAYQRLGKRIIAYLRHLRTYRSRNRSARARAYKRIAGQTIRMRALSNNSTDAALLCSLSFLSGKIGILFYRYLRVFLVYFMRSQGTATITYRVFNFYFAFFLRHKLFDEVHKSLAALHASS